MLAMRPGAMERQDAGGIGAAPKYMVLDRFLGNAGRPALCTAGWVRPLRPWQELDIGHGLRRVRWSTDRAFCPPPDDAERSGVQWGWQEASWTAVSWGPLSRSRVSGDANSIFRKMSLGRWSNIPAARQVAAHRRWARRARFGCRGAPIAPGRFTQTREEPN